MYKLENNVEWTTDLKNAFKHNVTRASILYTDENNDEVELNEENHLIDVTLEEERYIDGLGFVGSACARKLDITLQDTDNELNLENKELTLKIGADYNNSTYYINYGNFIVDEAPQIDETNGKMKIVAYDYMIKFNQPYVDRVNYPCSLLLLLQDICSQAGVTLATENFKNYDFIVTDNQFEGATLREVLMNIAKCAFSWARIGQDNKLYLDFSQTADATETLTIDDYKANAFKKSKEYYGPINQVTYADSSIEGQEERVKDQQSINENGLKELVIYDNLFAYTPEKRQALIQAGTYLFGLTYMPVSQLDAIGFIYLDCNDIINIETLDNQTYSTRIFSHTIKYTGTTSDSIATQGTSNNEEAYKNTAADIFQNQQTRIIVDKANKKINSVVEEIGDRSQKTTTITQDIDGIASKVEDIEDLTITVSGNKTITLEKCLEGYAMEMHIIGNNTVFDYLYPEDDLYPSNDLYPRGDSRIVVTDENNNSTTYELGITEVLRANSEVYDEYILEDNNAKVIRRVNPNGTTKASEEVQNLGKYTVYLSKGTNTVKIKNYVGIISVRYIPENSYTNQFATTRKMESAIKQSATEIMTTVSETFESKDNAETNYSRLTQTANQISTEVSKKVGNDEVISRINQSAESVKINAKKISLAGKNIDLTSESVTINSDNLSIDKNGNIRLKGGNGETGGTNSLSIDANTNVKLREYYNRIVMNNSNAGVQLDISIGDAPSGVLASFTASNGSGGYATLSAEDSGSPLISCGDGYGTVSSILPYKIKSGDYMEATAYNYISDVKLKKDIKEYNINALDKIKSGKIYQYKFKESNRKEFGLVVGEGYETPIEITEKHDDIYSINAYRMSAIMWKGIQEQQQQIEELKEEIRLLKGENYAKD